jgi:outer membrane protein TolC
MLIGLLAKTAILITEYAVERRKSGMSFSEAAQAAAQTRLRIVQPEAAPRAARLSYFLAVSLNPQATAGGFDGGKVSPTYQQPVGASWEVDSSATYLEVLTAQQTLLQVQLLQTANWFDEMQGITSLYRALTEM